MRLCKRVTPSREKGKSPCFARFESRLPTSLRGKTTETIKSFAGTARSRTKPYGIGRAPSFAATPTHCTTHYRLIAIYRCGR